MQLVAPGHVVLTLQVGKVWHFALAAAEGGAGAGLKGAEGLPHDKTAKSSTAVTCFEGIMATSAC